MEIFNNAELTRRLLLLENAVMAGKSREVGNTYRSEDALSKADAVTPTTYTKTAYIGDTEVSFTDVPSGNLTVYTDNLIAYSMAKDNDRVIVSFEPLTEVTTITISIV